MDVDALIDKPVRTKPTRKEIMLFSLRNPVYILREVCNRSLYRFVQELWSEYSNDTFVGNWHIELLCQELELIAKRVAAEEDRDYDFIANVPPGTSKTAITSIFFPIWCWTQWYWMKFITASYGETLSLESAEYSRDIMRCQKFKKIYPEIEIRTDKDQKGNFKIIKKEWKPNSSIPKVHQGGNRFSTSVGGTLTGFHGHILIVDDPINPNQALSEKELNNANHWVSQTLSTRKANKLTATTIMIMQRLHQNDPTGAILKNKKRRVKHLCLPGEIRNHREQVYPPDLAERYIDDLLDPKRMPWSVMDDLRADLGQYGYAGQIGQIPTPPGGGMFQVDKLQIVDKMPPEKHIISIVRYWDKAGTQDGGAFSAGVKMARLLDGTYLIMDVRRGQWGTNVRERQIKRTVQIDEPNLVTWIEQEPGSGGKESAESTVKNLAGFVIRKDRPQGDKIFRADPFSVQVNEGNVSMLRGDWNHAFIEEYKYFPFSTYKDQVDAGSGAFAKLTSKRIVKSY